MSGDDFYRVLHVRVVKVGDVPRERAVRFFKESPEGWCLQLRAPVGLGTFGLRDGKDFIVASASCSLDDLRALRDAIDEEIEAASRGCCGEFETGSGEHDEECGLGVAVTSSTRSSMTSEEDLCEE